MPCTMKICMMLLGEAPSVRRMAMSACLSVTAMTSVETILKAATSTMSDRMMNIIFFSIATDAEVVGVLARPVADVSVVRQLVFQLVGNLRARGRGCADCR